MTTPAKPEISEPYITPTRTAVYYAHTHRRDMFFRYEGKRANEQARREADARQ
jgi:hypothetical protein